MSQRIKSEREDRIATLLRNCRAVDDDASPEHRFAHVMGSERIYDHRTLHTTDDRKPDAVYGNEWTLMASYDLDSGERIAP